MQPALCSVWLSFYQFICTGNLNRTGEKRKRGAGGAQAKRRKKSRQGFLAKIPWGYAKIPAGFQKAAGSSEQKNWGKAVGAPTVKKVRNKARNHDAKLALLVVSKVAMNFESDVSAADTNVVILSIGKDGKVHVSLRNGQPARPGDKGKKGAAALVPKERLLCVVECDPVKFVLPAQRLLQGSVGAVSGQKGGVTEHRSGTKSGVSGP